MNSSWFKVLQLIVRGSKFCNYLFVVQSFAINSSWFKVLQLIVPGLKFCN